MDHGQHPTAPYTYIMQALTQTPTPNKSLSPLPFEREAVAIGGLGVNAAPSLTLQEFNDTVLISTFFHAGTLPVPDTILLSSDGVIFYVHSPTLVDACAGIFQPYIISSPLSDPKFRQSLIPIDTPSTELNIILHALYGSSSAAHCPSFDSLMAAVDRMPIYSISPEQLIRPSNALYNLLLSYTPLRPLELYALGACYSIHPIAVSASSYLLSYDLSNITDAMAERIGAVYLKKLFLLHAGRCSALKDILLRPPHLHPPNRDCGFENQRALTRAWALVSAHLAWDARPDLSTHTMQTTLQPLTENLACEMCRQALQNRIKTVVVNWASVKRAI